MLQNLPVRTKLMAILALPVLVMALLIVARVGGNVADSRRLDRLADITRVSNAAHALIHDLQRERDLSTAQAAGPRIFDQPALAEQRGRVDTSRRAFDAGVAELDLESTSPGLREQLTVVQRRLGGDLGIERAAVDKTSRGAAATIGFYTSTIETLLNFTAEIPAESDAVQFARDLNGVVAFARAKEAAALERSLVLGLLVEPGGGVDQGDVEQLVSTIGAGKVWLTQFDSLATDEQRARFTAIQAGPDAQTDNRQRRAVLSESGRLDADAKPLNWLASMNGVVDRYRTVEQGLGAAVLDEIAAVKADGERRAVSSSLLILLVLLFSVGISLAMAQSMVAALGRLRQHARDIAEHRLPAAVERLRRLEESDSVELDGASAPLPTTRSSDEIGEVAAAFGAVQTVAVRVATEQAALRKSVGDMFLNFARRSQALIDRQLELIRELRASVTGAEQQEEFSRLDHLATRMRRNAEDLIVLSGAKAPRRWSEPVPLADVIGIALAEVEDYKRVETMTLDELGIAGHAVSDVAHLLAELIENATSFSPPSTPVHIAGQTVTNGYVIEIEDQGIGMTDTELVDANERLANPADVDLAISSRLGLYVVGRLADRYGIKVQLRHSWYDGVAALVLLPDQLVTLPAGIAASPASAARAAGSPRLRETPAIAPPPPAPRPRATDEVRLPIFEQTRSDWFESRPAPARPEAGRHAAPPPPPPPEHTETGLPRRVPRMSMAPALAAEPLGPGRPPAATNGNGVPNGTRPRKPAPPPRTPDDVRRTLAAYRSGFERGRHEASTGGRHEKPAPPPTRTETPPADSTVPGS
jgi:signal transduction histidine kinase